MGVKSFLVNMFGPAVVLSALDKQNPEELADEVGALLDKLLDSQFGDQKSEKIQVVLVPFIKRFSDRLSTVLLADQQTGDE